MPNTSHLYKNNPSLKSMVEYRVVHAFYLTLLCTLIGLREKSTEVSGDRFEV